MVASAFDKGINFVDNVNVYSRGNSEEITGEALKRSGQRDRLILATKVHVVLAGDDPNMQGTSRRHPIEQCLKSLQRLQTDYIKLYQLHRPVTNLPIDETLCALDDLIRDGKVDVHRRHYLRGLEGAGIPLGFQGIRLKPLRLGTAAVPHSGSEGRT